ncbi:5-oxoprolinase subunit PxpB [Thalassorhabdus alkalitolerans]|uniref:5-oxoprolinase subunit PxpB n=1 Tax=Thalassorhabdus alkalitolerans TaxID=2282697 RepID=A0ABW0YMY5_9BACI|nr:5-oxoprolinase subunit PxpB [Bacillus sp. FJAT-44742]
MSHQVRMLPLGDSAIRMEVGKTISKETNSLIRAYLYLLKETKMVGINEWVPSYTAITFFYDPFLISYEKAAEWLYELSAHLQKVKLPPPVIYDIPTYYGGESGPDLKRVAEINNLSPEEVVSIHSSESYLIYMIGFTPGFPYLGGMSEKIAAPRLSKPRGKVAEGSVGIAGEQTGIYSLESPGGWNIIGRTPIKLFDQHREHPFLVESGNYIRFVPVENEEYEKIKIEVDRRVYQLTTRVMEGTHELSSGFKQ